MCRWTSVGGLDADGATNTNQLVVETQHAMISQAESVAVLADSSKWKRREMARAFTWNEVNVFVTNGSPPAESNLTSEVLLAET